MRKNSSHSGLTLMELIVVLVILVALAGILIPMLPSMIDRAHTATGATNTAEVNKFVQMYEQLYQSYPSSLDALTDQAGAAIADYVPNGMGQLQVITLNAGQAAALQKAGITQLAEMVATKAAFGPNNDPTFNPYTGNLINITNSTKVVSVTENAVEMVAGLVQDDPLNVGDIYVVFGVGKRCTMIGKVMAEPPTHFAETASGNAANAYARIGLVFRVTRGSPGAPTNLDRAVFVGAVELMDEGIAGSDAHLKQYYNITK
jgi:prepilin-type N-terminal cleavage/methylation domain-containing protein